MKPIVAVPATAALVYRAWSRKSLTPAGIVVAALTAVAHAIHPWSVFFALLVVFFLGGTAVTKVKHNEKARLTQSSAGSSGGEGPRNYVQVLANSAVASILILVHAYKIYSQGDEAARCWPRSEDVLVVGIVSQYAAVAADTFSSELGILAKTAPRLITAPWKAVPRGTNGGVTFEGLVAGLGGSVLISATTMLLLPFCPFESNSSNPILKGYSRDYRRGWTPQSRVYFFLAMTFAGFCGTVLDSLLGALLQASVVDQHTGRVIEGEGGRKVLVHAANGEYTKGTKGEKKDSHGSRSIATGTDILSNNGVNVLMAVSISVSSMAAASSIWGIPLVSILA